MSIEALIKAHTEALLENTAAVKNLTLSLAGGSAAAASKAADAVVEKPKAEKAVKTKDEALADGAKECAEALAKAEPLIDDTQNANVPYETVRALLLKLAPTNRDGVKAVLTSAGIANLKVLLDKEDDFTTVNDQAKLEAVYADLQALEA